MRFRTAVSVRKPVSRCFTFAAWSAPTRVVLVPGTCNPHENQSLSGSISSIGDAEFSMDVQRTRMEEVRFLVDDNTKVEANLPLREARSVPFKRGDKNIAVRVVLRRPQEWALLNRSLRRFRRRSFLGNGRLRTAAKISNSSAAACTQPVSADFRIDQPESLDAHDSEIVLP